MLRRIALKRLTASDLTLFEWQFRNRNAGNQKSINLNADVFVNRLYPSLPDAAAELNGRLPLDLYIYGPGHGPAYNLQRKIVKGNAYKNWRLNGEYIANPEDQPDRFNILEPGDLAIFEFQGRMVPNSAKLVLISQKLTTDLPIYEELSGLLEEQSMVSVSVPQLQAIASRLRDDAHPFHELTLDAELEDAALGGERGTTALRRRPGSRVLTSEDLQRAIRAAEEVGRAGEELVDQYLRNQKKNGLIKDFVWESEKNAVAPYDFKLLTRDGQEIEIDVKSTSGEFERRIHISTAELLEISKRQYHIYRVYEVSDAGGSLRIAMDVSALVTAALSILSKLPDGVEVDSVSVDVSFIGFGDAVALQPPSPEEQVP